MDRLKFLVAFCLLVLTCSCGGSSTAGDQSSASPPGVGGSPSASLDSSPLSSPPAASPSGESAFCTGFKGNGGGLASIGEPPTFYPKEQLVSYAQETLAVMKDLVPPTPIAAAWTQYQQFHTRLLAAAQSLGAGDRLGAPVAGRAALKPAYTKINDWISANC